MFYILIVTFYKHDNIFIDDVSSTDQCVLGEFPNAASRQCERCPGLRDDVAARHSDCRVCSVSSPDDSNCLGMASHLYMDVWWTICKIYPADHLFCR